MKLTYLDNPVLQDIACSMTPDSWNKFSDWFTKEFGHTLKPVESVFLFLEYIGFKKGKLKMPVELLSPQFNTVLPDNVSDDQINIHQLDEKLTEIFKAMVYHIKTRLLILKDYVEQLIKTRQSFACVQHFPGCSLHRWEKSLEIEEAFFGYFLQMMRDDFNRFVEYLAEYLAWNEFCGIHQGYLSREHFRLLRKRQLGIWLQYHEQGTTLPVAKILDDLDLHAIPNKSRFHDYKDMVDAEIFTLLMTGHRVETGELKSIIVVTYDGPEQIDNRIALVEKSVIYIEETLRRPMQRVVGEIYYDFKNGSLIPEKVKRPNIPIIL